MDFDQRVQVDLPITKSSVSKLCPLVVGLYLGNDPGRAHWSAATYVEWIKENMARLHKWSHTLMFIDLLSYKGNLRSLYACLHE